MQEKFKDVEINGMKFRIKPVSARDGSWIVNIILGQKYHEPVNYNRTQDIVLNKCEYLRPNEGQADIPQQLYLNGRWLAPDLGLDTDVDTVTSLYEEAMDFSIIPTLRRLIANAQAEASKREEALITNQSSFPTP